MALFESLYPLTEISRFRKRYDDDFIDRLHNRYSALIFIVLAILISTRQYVGDPISCFVPAEFHHEWVDYTNKICWISNTYYVPPDKNIPSDEVKKETEIAYYQWVPLMIFLQVLLFFAPSMVWKTLNSQSGIHVNKIVSVVSGAEHSSPEVRQKTLKYIVRNLDRALLSQREYRSGCLIQCRQKLAKECCIICGKRYGNYLISLYLFVKLLYIANGVGQIVLLNEFLGDGYYIYGWQALKHMYKGDKWNTSRRFPRVTMCDFYVRRLGGKLHEYTVQCTLPINLFNEKVFIFIWFWLVFVTAATLLNFVIWMWTLFRRNRRQYVRKYLKIMNRNFNRMDKMPAREFYEDYLRQDGIFLLRLIAKNTNDVVVGEIIQAMWDHYKKEHQKPSNEDV